MQSILLILIFVQENPLVVCVCVDGKKGAKNGEEKKSSTKLHPYIFQPQLN